MSPIVVEKIANRVLTPPIQRHIKANKNHCQLNISKEIMVKFRIKLNNSCVVRKDANAFFLVFVEI